MKLTEQVDGPDEVNVATTLNNVGLLLQAMGTYSIESSGFGVAEITGCAGGGSAPHRANRGSGGFSP